MQRKPVRKVEMFTDVNLRSIRPGFGIKAKHFDALLGRRAARDIAFGKPLDASMIEGGFEA
ncbi:SAF domain-containing protein [Rhizobium anhuiense]|uniref:SAF domain-containing protein n=1 Tax=Rhizobium anhuiense TaxID=1184720 RepID=UPI000646D676|nr:SAF domain-containing protein [Rhizobium anhuiense]